MKITPAIVKAFLIAPFNIMITIPGVILWISFKWGIFKEQNFIFSLTTMFLGMVFIVMGIYFAFRSVGDLTNRGEDGTPAPWNPPKNLVVKGIYQRIRNPMVTGVSFVLFGETLIFGSLPLFLWLLIWLAGNLIYTPLIEEPELERRFGDSYHQYKKQVPRWFPRY